MTLMVEIAFDYYNVLWYWYVYVYGVQETKKVHDTHVEVLKRADGLLCFMADHGHISDEHLDLLWAAGTGQPDAQVKTRRECDRPLLIDVSTGGGSARGGRCLVLLSVL